MKCIFVNTIFSENQDIFYHFLYHIKIKKIKLFLTSFLLYNIWYSFSFSLPSSYIFWYLFLPYSVFFFFFFFFFSFFFFFFFFFVSSRKSRISSQASSEQTEPKSRPQVSREMLPIMERPIQCRAWVCITC